MRPIWDSHTTVHNPMFDERARLVFTARIRGSDQSASAKQVPGLISAQLTPVIDFRPPMEMYDPATRQSLDDSTPACGTHPLAFCRGCQQHLVDHQWEAAVGLWAG